MSVQAASSVDQARSAMSRPPQPGQIVVWSDIGCPWGTLAVERLHAARDRLGLRDAVAFDHRPFPLELFNARPTPKLVLDAELPVVAGLEPTLGWRPWNRPASDYPGSLMLALEAVQAAKEQGLASSAELDLALRRAFFVQRRSINVWPEVVAVARETDGVDADAVEEALAHGRGRADVVAAWQVAPELGVKGSPHLFLPDGTDVHNPAITMAWAGEPGAGFPVVEEDREQVFDDLLRRAAA
jgi:predicted DsbA family dithiol-disulfide isomerase